MKKTSYIVALLFPLFIISCNNEDDYIIPDTNNEVYGFSLRVKGTDASSFWTTDDAIGITAYMSDSEELYLSAFNKQYKSAGNAIFTPASKENVIYRPLANNVVDFIAYYPYQADAFTTYTIALSEQSNQKRIDLLYSNNAKGKTNTSGNIEFVFDHVLSKIIIKIKPSDGLVEEDLIGLNITLNNVFCEGTLNLVNGGIVPSGQKTSINMNTEADGSSGEAIILPGTAANSYFTIKLANGNIYDADFQQGQQFVPGHIHTYNVTITRTGISLSPIEIEDWVIMDTNMQEEIADEIIYKTGDFYPNPNNSKTAIGVVYWLKPGTGGREGKIVSYNTVMRNWGDSDNTDLGTSISTGVINWNIIINMDPTLEKFPAFKWCKDKGEGWYLPSRYELHVLNELWTNNREYMNSNIELINGEIFTTDDVYLVSSESRSWPKDRAEIYDFSTKGWGPIDKIEAGRIRAVKEF